MARNIYKSINKVKMIMIYLIFNFIITFIVFPGVCNYTNLSFLKMDDKWHEILYITTFNFFDTIGRFIGFRQRVLKIRPRYIYILTLFRGM